MFSPQPRRSSSGAASVGLFDHPQVTACEPAKDHGPRTVDFPYRFAAALVRTLTGPAPSRDVTRRRPGASIRRDDPPEHERIIK